MNPLLSIQDLCIAAQAKPLVDHLSLEIAPGETLALVGESGSGKSLSALSVMGLLPSNLQRSSGRIKLSLPEQQMTLTALKEKEWTGIRGRHIGMIFQEPMSAFSQVKTVGDQVGESLVRHKGLSRAAARARAADLLDELDVPNARDVVRRYPFEFSGGMLQRAMIARCIACEPALILADEPTTALDVTVQAQVLRLLKRVQENAGSAMLFITHDLAVAQQVADRVAVMQHGKVIEQGPACSVLRTPHHSYTKDLLRALPRLDIPEPSAPHSAPILKLRNLSLSYGGTQPLFGRPKPAKIVLSDVSMEMARGEIVGLVGESGSGKTTLARAILGLARAQRGQAMFYPSTAEPFDTLRLTATEQFCFWRKAQMVFQNPYASLNPWLSVEQTLTEPLINHGISTGAEAVETARQTLEQCGLDAGALPRFPHSFSGGQRQRIAIARALVTQPELVICDEPMSALDVSTQARIIELLKALRRDMGLSFLLITHDLAVASQLCDRIVVMQRGQIVEQGPTNQVFGTPQSTYTQELLAAVPRIEPESVAV
jgi:peptide/nickel transport system ATP-binding protein